MITVELERQNREIEQGLEGEDLPPAAPVSVGYISCRLSGFEPVTPLRQLKANYYGIR